jgi:hypothetical protein
MKIQDKKSYDTLIETKQKSPFEKFADEIKNLTFSVLYVLLKEEEADGNVLIYVIQTVFDYFQLIQFLFGNSLVNLWNSKEVFGNVNSFFSFFNITNYFGKIITVEMYLIIFYFFIILILFILLDIIYVSISFKRKKFSVIWPLNLLRNFVNFAVTVLFLFITETLLTVVF